MTEALQHQGSLKEIFAFNHIAAARSNGAPMALMSMKMLLLAAGASRQYKTPHGKKFENDVGPKIINPKLARTSPRELTNAIRKCRSIEDLLSLCKNHEATLSESHVGGAWQKVGRLRPGKSFEGAQSLVEITVRVLAKARPRTIATIAYSAARGRFFSPSLFNTIAKKAQELIRDFNSQDVANTAWAFAKLNQPAHKLFEAVAKIAPERLRYFKSQALANTVWAFAKLKQPAPKLFEAVAKIAPERLRDFNSQALANTVWAFATLNQTAPKLFEAVAKIAPERLRDFNSQDVANTVWAFATLNQPWIGCG